MTLPDRIMRMTVNRAGVLRDALARLEEGAAEIVLVVEGERLVGVLTDGDVRRALLSGNSLEQPLAPFIVADCVTVAETASRADVLELMHARRISQVPVIDAERRLVGVHLVHDMLGMAPRANTAVVMCGGRGTRLAPLTNVVPKPMLKVAGRPILERIVLHLAGFGIRRVLLAVNYLAEQIESHFGNGSQFGVEITYLREDRPLGTAGALSLIEGPISEPLLVMNGDLVTQFSVDAMLAFHDHGKQRVTVGTRRYFHTVPFGCIELDGTRITQFEEKPTLSRVVNTGIYVLEPQLLERIPKGEPFNMPDLLEGCLQREEAIRSFEIVDDWIDVGQRDQLKQARGESET